MTHSLYCRLAFLQQHRDCDKDSDDISSTLQNTLQKPPIREYTIHQTSKPCTYLHIEVTSILLSLSHLLIHFGVKVPPIHLCTKTTEQKGFSKIYLQDRYVHQLSPHFKQFNYTQQLAAGCLLGVLHQVTATLPSNCHTCCVY